MPAASNRNRIASKSLDLNLSLTPLSSGRQIELPVNTKFTIYSFCWACSSSTSQERRMPLFRNFSDSFRRDPSDDCSGRDIGIDHCL